MGVTEAISVIRMSEQESDPPSPSWVGPAQTGALCGEGARWTPLFLRLPAPSHGHLSKPQPLPKAFLTPHLASLFHILDLPEEFQNRGTGFCFELTWMTIPAPQGKLRQKACHVGTALENHPDLRKSGLSGGLWARDGKQEGRQLGFVQGVEETEAVP